MLKVVPRWPSLVGHRLGKAFKELFSWKEFQNWLLREYKPRTAKERFSYALKYAGSLFNGDLSGLRSLSVDKRLHVLKALSALAKFLGVYEDFKSLVKNYGLKWSVQSDDVIINRLTKTVDSDEVYEWVRMVKREKPCLAEFMDFMALTGLRLIEALESYNLIVKLAREGKLGEYYNENRGVLEHFRFKEVFIRRTKKAFISFVPKSLVEAVSRSKPLTLSNVLSVRKRGFRLRFGDIREANGTFLTKYLRESEIDFLHGRVSTSVFMRNYFNPALIGDLKERVFKGLAEIQTKI